jgi:hypothetical protein
VPHPSRLWFMRNGADLNAAPRQPSCRNPTLRAGPTLERLSAHAEKTCTKPVRRNWYRYHNISVSLNQICPVEQLFSPRLRATFERKLKYETLHTIIYPENLPAAGSKGVPCQPLPQRGTAVISIFSLRRYAKSNR